MLGTCGMPPGTNDYYHVKMSTLKALQLRMNWIFLGNYSLAPPVFQYMLKTLGKTVSDSPDAWVALREAEDRERGSPGPVVRNWERWLIQREVGPDGLTVRTVPITSPATQIGTSYEARRTDHASASNYIYFGVDDKFIKGGPEAVDVYVTYLDNNHATWTLQYDSAGGSAYKSTRVVTNTADGRWKTTKFAIEDAGFANRQNGGMDFRLYNGGVEDATVRFVQGRQGECARLSADANANAAGAANPPPDHSCGDVRTNTHRALGWRSPVGATRAGDCDCRYGTAATGQAARRLASRDAVRRFVYGYNLADVFQAGTGRWLSRVGCRHR